MHITFSLSSASSSSFIRPNGFGSEKRHGVTWLTVTVTCSIYEKSSWCCPLSKQWMVRVCGGSLAGRTDI